MTKLLCLDSSTKCTGWALYVDGELFNSGYLDRSDIEDVQDRMIQMYKDILSIIKLEDPDLIYMETPKQGNNQDTLRKLSMIIGAVWGYCIEHNIYFEEFAPSVWRKYANTNNEKLPRKRDELKLWSLRRVKEIFGKETDHDDESDAILLGYSGLNKYKD